MRISWEISRSFRSEQKSIKASNLSLQVSLSLPKSNCKHRRRKFSKSAVCRRKSTKTYAESHSRSLWWILLRSKMCRIKHSWLSTARGTFQWLTTWLDRSAMPIMWAQLKLKRKFHLRQAVLKASKIYRSCKRHSHLRTTSSPHQNRRNKTVDR